MKTLQDFEIEITRVREAISDLTISGHKNASLLVYAIEKCNAMIGEIRQIASQKPTGQNGVETEVEKNAGE